MSWAILQYILYAFILIGLGIPLGLYMGKVMNGERVFLSRILVPVENAAYKLLRV
jgi:K+-transporting ATPase ATPase A chain